MSLAQARIMWVTARRRSGTGWTRPLRTYQPMAVARSPSRSSQSAPALAGSFWRRLSVSAQSCSGWRSASAVIAPPGPMAPSWRSSPTMISFAPDRSTAVRSRAKSTLLPVFAKRPIASIEPIDVRRFMAEKQAAGQAAKSLQKLRLVLRQVLELARASGAIKSNPCDGLRLPKAVQMEPTFLSADQVEALARATRPPYDLLVRLVAATGLRPSEACGLRVGSVNPRKRTIEISPSPAVAG